MDDAPSCGKGLAEHSLLVAKLGELTAAVAENLELHTRSLDPGDEAAREERTAYQELVTRHRAIASQLDLTARRMAGYRDLPMARHDEAALSDERVVNAFVQLVARERELLELLQRSLDRDQAMLAQAGP
jgi:hypothetical protein